MTNDHPLPLTAPRTSDEWRAFFRERGWTITMDDRPGQAFDPFVHVADASQAVASASNSFALHPGGLAGIRTLERCAAALRALAARLSSQGTT